MSNYCISNGELYHYGVLGMKWGVRRGRTTKAYGKASKKLNKLDRKADKALETAYGARERADRKMGSVFSTRKGRYKAEANARKAMRKATVKAAKARKWLNAMDATFKNTDISLSKEQIEMGRKYVQTLSNRTFG